MVTTVLVGKWFIIWNNIMHILCYSKKNNWFEDYLKIAGFNEGTNVFVTLGKMIDNNTFDENKQYRCEVKPKAVWFIEV